MTSQAVIKCFTLNLSKTVKGNPKNVTMSCVYSFNGNQEAPMAIGYVLAIDDTITEMRCFNEGIEHVQAFMNTDKTPVNIQGGGIILSFRLGFMDKRDELTGFMMQGEDGNDIVTTENYSEEDLEALLNYERA